MSQKCLRLCFLRGTLIQLDVAAALTDLLMTSFQIAANSAFRKLEISPLYLAIAVVQDIYLALD